jgi:hypothetical protein
MDYEQAQLALHNKTLTEAVIMPAEDANGWVVLLVSPQGDRHVFTGHTGTEKVYHTLDRATEVAREIGFETVRVEEAF